MKSTKKIISILCLIYCSNLFAWGKLGHRITGEIAEQYLSKKTQESINKLLGQKINSTSVGLSLMSNHADFIKSDSDMRKKYNHWHYLSYDSKDNIKEYVSKNLKKENIIYGIEYFSKILRDKKAKNEDRIFALKFIVHLIGDLHQPLHLGKESDQGGNKIKLKWFGQGTNLHAIWDEKLIQLQELSYTEYSNNLGKISKDDLKKWRTGDILSWAQESKDYVSKLYDMGKGKYWEYDYNYIHLAFMNQRLQMGGVRLAFLLNQLLP